MEDFKIISWEELHEAEQKGNRLFSEDTAISIGCFDGVHLGHKKLFEFVLNYSKKNNCKAGLISFFRPTGLTKNPDYAGDVSSLRLKLKKIKDLGFHFIVLIDFSAEFAKIAGTVFFDILIKTIRLKYLAVGEDFSCGYRRGLDAAQIKELASRKGFCFDSIKAVAINGNLKVSSTAIRNAVYSADFTLAKNLLGYPFLFDIIVPPWQVIENEIIASRNFLTQILPECGKYKVFVNDIFGTKTEAELLITKENISLSFNEDSLKKGNCVPANFIQQNLNNFDTIEFINKE